MGRAGGGEFGEEVGDGVDVGTLHYGRGLAFADLDANVWRLVQGAETVLIGDVIAQEDHCGGSGALAQVLNPRALGGLGGGELHHGLAGRAGEAARIEREAGFIGLGGSFWIGILERAQVQNALEGLDLDVRAGEALHDRADLSFLGGEVLAHRGGQFRVLPRGLGAVGAAEENGLAQRAHALEAF